MGRGGAVANALLSQAQLDKRILGYSRCDPAPGGLGLCSLASPAAAHRAVGAPRKASPRLQLSLFIRSLRQHVLTQGCCESKSVT